MNAQRRNDGPRTAEDFDRLGNIWATGEQHDQQRLGTIARFAGRHIKDPLVVLECGPLHGDLTVKLLTVFPRAELHLIEIAPSHAATLRERFSDEPRVTVYEADMLALPSLPIPPADAVLLVECLYYLDREERRALVETLLLGAHVDATVLVTTPLDGGRYFTDRTLRRLFIRYRVAATAIDQDRHGIYVLAPSPFRRRLSRLTGVRKRLRGRPSGFPEV
jgi:Methyltransferase domain